MNEWVIITSVIFILVLVVGLLLFLFLWKKKKAGDSIEPNYQALFSIGLIWVSVGVVFMVALNYGLGIAFMGLGVVYMVIGLAHRDTWVKK